MRDNLGGAEAQAFLRIFLSQRINPFDIAWYKESNDTQTRLGTRALGDSRAYKISEDQMGGFTVEVETKSAKGEGKIRRIRSAKKQLVTTVDDSIKTVADILPWAAKKYGDKDCLGARTLIKQHEDEKMITKMVDGKEQRVPKKWTYFELSGYEFLSFTEALEHAKTLGRGLVKAGLKQNDRLELFASTT